MIRLLLVDDQTLVRQGFRVLLEANPDLQVVGEAENGQQAIAFLERCANQQELYPDLVLMDVRMPEMNGLAATQLIRQRFVNVKVLVLSTFDDDTYVAQAMQFGATGYLLKDTDSQELAQAIRLADKGYTQLGPGLFPKTQSGSQDTLDPNFVSSTADVLTLSPELEQLTGREREVLCLIIAGSTNRQIAETLLNLSDRIQAAMLAGPFLPLLKTELRK
jgi:DNA-binding NarL/FixJ family response regulator